MQPILILTRTFAICGIVVGAFAAPLPSSISGKSVQSLESREPTGFASVQPELVVLPEVAAREEKREPWHLCMGGCMRDLGDEEEVAAETDAVVIPRADIETREPEPAPESEPIPEPAPEPEPEREVQEEKREPWALCMGGCF